MITTTSLDLPVVTLRKTQPADLGYVLTAEEDQENRPFIIPWTHDQHNRSLSDPNCAHLIVEAETRVGYVILVGLRDPNKSIEFRRIVVTEKGHGFGKATVLQVQKLVFDMYDAHRLWLDVKAQNHRARSIYEKSGFTVDGVLRECLLSDHKYESLVVLSILRQEYEAQLIGRSMKAP
jgi:diamine N-acetyltransferase